MHVLQFASDVPKRRVRVAHMQFDQLPQRLLLRNDVRRHGQPVEHAVRDERRIVCGVQWLLHLPGRRVHHELPALPVLRGDHLHQRFEHDLWTQRRHVHGLHRVERVLRMELGNLRWRRCVRRSGLSLHDRLAMPACS
jgi:hypothetical protein